ncbi:MAG: hypothetical protein LBS19_04955 [Clostridiales bacterium]|jgi:hypothetical protein|nr:hypothetical protein [Clostridiales bacterium]
MLALALSGCDRFKNKVQDGVKDALDAASPTPADAQTADPVQDDQQDYTSGGGDFGLTDEEIKAADEAWDMLEQMALAAGWTDSNYGASIYGVWDSEVLPGCVPNEIAGVKAEDTGHKEKRHETYSGSYSVGSMYMNSKEYEQWSLWFYCTNDQLAEFVAQMEQNGFIGGLSSDGYYPEYEWLGNGYYAYMRVNSELFGEEEYDSLAMFQITPQDSNPYPVAFRGTRLPAVGAVLNDYSEGAGEGWDEADDDYVYNIWNVFSDSGNTDFDAWLHT